MTAAEEIEPTAERSSDRFAPLKGKKIAITGAGRGLGKALAIAVADAGALPILLGRSMDALQAVVSSIDARVGPCAVAIQCDLADFASIANAAGAITRQHPDLDVLVHNGAQWASGALEDQGDHEIAAVVGSAVTGTISLTRSLLPLLKARPRADIHTVVSMSGLQYARFVGASLPFRAAKAAQDGFVQGLVEELRDTNVRVTSIYPGIIERASPEDMRWNSDQSPDAPLTERNVVDAIIFALAAPPMFRYGRL